MTTAQPLCRSCGKPIAKHSETVYFRDPENVGKPGMPASHLGISRHLDVAYPQSKAEAARHVNGEIISVRRWPGCGITAVGVWDGETYRDQFFCSNACAIRLGRAVARQGMVMPEYNAA